MLGEGKEGAGFGRNEAAIFDQGGGAGRREAPAAILPEGTGDLGTLRQFGRVPWAAGTEGPEGRDRVLRAADSGQGRESRNVLERDLSDVAQNVPFGRGGDSRGDGQTHGQADSPGPCPSSRPGSEGSAVPVPAPCGPCGPCQCRTRVVPGTRQLLHSTAPPCPAQPEIPAGLPGACGHRRALGIDVR